MSSDWKFFLDACHETFDDNQLFEDYARRFSFGTDASFYRLVPKLVVKISDENQLAQLFGLAQQFNVPLTLRVAGTSLSGQAVTDSVLVLLRAHWNQIKILEAGNKITLQPGVIGADANKALSPLNRKIGPDQASINTCKIGGIVANNASGMCCGTAHNSYNTLAGIRIMFADGSVLDTRDPTNVACFRLTHQHLLAELETLGNLTKKTFNWLKKFSINIESRILPVTASML